jgi:hypothetical protein
MTGRKPRGARARLAAEQAAVDAEQRNREQWWEMCLSMQAVTAALRSWRELNPPGDATALLATVYASQALREQARLFAAWVNDRHSAAIGAARDPAFTDGGAGT